MVQLGDRLKVVREFLGETQKTMSRRFRLGESTWQSYELNGKLPKGETLSELAALGIDMNWLLTGRGSMQMAAGRPESGDGALALSPRESGSVLDLALLSEAIALVEQGLDDQGRRLSSRAKGNLVAALYGLALAGEDGGGSGSRPPRASPSAAAHLLWLALQMDDAVRPVEEGDGAVRPP